MAGWLTWFGWRKSHAAASIVRADGGGFAVSGDVRDSMIRVGLDEEAIARHIADAQRPIVEQLVTLADQVAHERGVEPAPLLAMLERIYATLQSRHIALYGRKQELEEVVRMLSRKSPYKGLAIQAMGGMGKTALARESCIAREIWKSYDIVLGVQASKRQIRVDTRQIRSKVIRFDQLGTILRLRELLVTIAKQLDVQDPETRTDTDLEKQIVQHLSEKSALIIIDNLETMESMVDVLAFLDRICVPPTRRALITTRQFPEDHPAHFGVVSLGTIRDASACRSLVMDRLGSYFAQGAEGNIAIDAIVEVGKGHPLALEFLTGKLITQGLRSILELHEKWRRSADDQLNDEFLSALCDHVFDNRFREYVGPMGVDLLSEIAQNEIGVDEDMARLESGLSNDDFDIVLSKLFESSCIHRELFVDLSVLAMHPITQAYFRGDRS